MPIPRFVHRLLGHRLVEGRWSDGEPDRWCRTCEPDYYDWHRRGRTFVEGEDGTVVTRVGADAPRAS